MTSISSSKATIGKFPSSPPSAKDHANPPKKLVKFSNSKPVKIRDGSFMIMPRSVFKSPFEKFKFESMIDKEERNWEITNHCNYGFNYDTIKSYALLLKRFIQMYELRGSQRLYDCSSSGLLRLNDQLPLEFGGFSPPIDQRFQKFDQANGHIIGDVLYDTLIGECCGKDWALKFPLIELVKKINDSRINDNQLSQAVTQVLSHITHKYQSSMVAILKRNEELGIVENQDQVLFLQQSRSKSKPPPVNLYDQIFQACKNSASQKEQKKSKRRKKTKSERKTNGNEAAKRMPTESIQEEEISKKVMNDKKSQVLCTKKVTEKKQIKQAKKQMIKKQEIKEQEDGQNQDSETTEKKSEGKHKLKYKNIKKHKKGKHNKKHKHKKHKKHGKGHHRK